MYMLSVCARPFHSTPEFRVSRAVNLALVRYAVKKYSAKVEEWRMNLG